MVADSCQQLASSILQLAAGSITVITKTQDMEQKKGGEAQEVITTNYRLSKAVNRNQQSMPWDSVIYAWFSGGEETSRKRPARHLGPFTTGSRLEYVFPSSIAPRIESQPVGRGKSGGGAMAMTLTDVAGKCEKINLREGNT